MGKPVGVEEAVRKLILADRPDVLTLEEVAEVCGKSLTWAKDRARCGDLPVLPGNGNRLVGKLALLGWLAGPHAEALYRALFHNGHAARPSSMKTSQSFSSIVKNGV